MTKPLTKEELIRSAWITELRRQGERQCVGFMFAPESYSAPKVCALALLAECIWPATWRQSNEHQAGYAAGLSDAQIEAVIEMNDRRRRTFAEIADVIESWFKK